LLAARRSSLTGILEGLDLDAWDPTRDRALAARYDEATLERRARNKRALQREVGLAMAADTPLVAAAVRGGGEVMLGAMAQLLADPAPVGAIQTILLGAGSPAMDREARALARQYPGRAAAVGRASAELLHRVCGGADMVLVDEPGQTGGLAHRVALRYGAVPVARQTGSAADMVVEGGRRGNGFGFADYNAASLLAAVRRALGVYRQPAKWQALARRGMRQAQNWGWERAARSYLALYQQALVQREEP
jgi:starch synthase